MKFLYNVWGFLMYRLITEPAYEYEKRELIRQHPEASVFFNDRKFPFTESAPEQGVLDAKLAEGAVRSAADAGDGR